MATNVGKQESFIDAIKALTELDFDAVGAYEVAMDNLENPEYKQIILKSADILATLYNPKAGTILSWPREVKKFGGHNTIIDNMIKPFPPHSHDCAGEMCHGTWQTPCWAAAHRCQRC